MEPFLKGTDFQNIRDAVRETGSIFKQTIVVHRFVSFTGGTLNGIQPTRTNTDIPMMARVHSVSSKDILNSGGYYQDGDVITDTENSIIGVSNVKGAVTQPDQMTYNGQLFSVQGAPQPKFAVGGRVYTKTLWRRV
jgi:hypothetical protein